ncbi:MAG: response regulator [Pseudomonadota bacterium]
MEQNPPDCVVLDLRLPDMTGFDVLEQIRENASLNDLPVVVFTGRELSPEEGRPAAHDRAQRGRQGCRVPGTAARRDRAVPAPRGGGPAGPQAAAARAGCTTPTRI